jgi:hypothetical protein
LRSFAAIPSSPLYLHPVSPHHFSAKVRQPPQDPESKQALKGSYSFRYSMNKPTKENWTTGDISGFGLAFALVLLGTIVSAYSDHPTFWLLIGPGPLVIGLTLIAFLRHLFSVRRGLTAQGRNTKMTGLSWLNSLYRKENSR